MRFLILLGLIISPYSIASHHFESSLAKEFPKLDITDTFVFSGENNNSTVFAISFNPNSKLENGIDDYADFGTYAIHVKIDKSSTRSYLFSKSHNKIQVNRTSSYLSDNPMLNVSDLGEFSFGKEIILPDGVRVWSGTIRDPFFADAHGFREFVQGAKEGVINKSIFLRPSREEFFQSRFTTGIVVEVPNRLLGDRVEVYSTSLLKDKNDGHWHQINYSANPLLTNLYLFDDQIKKIKNQHLFDADDIVRDAIRSNVSKATGGSHLKKEHANFVANTIVPDVISYQIGTVANYSLENQNGRKLSDDVFDTTLSHFAGESISDAYSKNVNMQKRFPYFVPAI